MTYPAFQVDIAWGVASSDVPAGGDWVDVTVDILELSATTGRQDEFAQPGAGTATLVLDNSDGDYDPDNASGPNYGDLLPLTWVRIQGGTTAANTGVFYGQVSIEGWRLSASQFADSVVTIEIVDMFEQLANTLLPGGVYELEVAADTPEAWWRLSESSGTTAFDSSGNEHHGEYDGGVTFNSRTGLIEGDPDNALLIDPGRLVMPMVRSDWDFTVSGWIDVPDEVAYNGTILLMTDNGGSEPGAVNSVFVGYQAIANEAIPYVEIIVGGATAADGAWRLGTALEPGVHRITAYIPVVGAAVPAGIKLCVDGVAVTGTTGGALGTLPAFPSMNYADAGADSTLDEITLYDGELSSVRDAAQYAAGTEPWASELTSDRFEHLLDAVGIPSGLRTVDTGYSTMPAADLASGELLGALLEVVKAERGEFYVDHHDAGKLRFRSRRARWTDTRSLTSQATFGDSGSEVTYTNIDLQDDRIINSATVQRTEGSNITVTDAASITQYQTRSHSETGLLIESDAEAQNRAELIVAEKKDRHRRVRSITLEPAKSTHSAWAQVFARQIGDRVTVKWRPPYGGTYSWDSWIIGRSLSWRPAASQPLRVVFYLQPVPYGTTAEPYWIAGTSTAGVTTRAGY